MAVMEEVQSQMTEITSKQKEKVDELNAEIRKLKVRVTWEYLVKFKRI